jgi:hypothetical protein
MLSLYIFFLYLKNTLYSSYILYCSHIIYSVLFTYYLFCTGHASVAREQRPPDTFKKVHLLQENIERFFISSSCLRYPIDKRRKQKMFFEIKCTEPTKWVPSEEEEGITKILNGQYIKWGASSASIDIVAQSNSKKSSFHVGLYDYESKKPTDRVSYETRVQYLESDEIVQGTKHLRTIIQKGALTVDVSEKPTTNVRVHVSDCSQRLGYLIFCLGVYSVEKPESVVYSLPFLVGTKSRSIGKCPVALSVPMATIRELRGDVERPKKRRCIITPTVSSSSDTEEDEPSNSETDVSETDTPPSGASSGASDAPSGNWKAYVDQSHAKLLRSIQKQHKDTLEKMGAMMENMKQSMDDALQQQNSERALSRSNSFVDFSQMDDTFDFTLEES